MRAKVKVKARLHIEQYQVEYKRLVYATERSRDAGIQWHNARGWLCVGWRLVTPRDGKGGTKVAYEANYTRTTFGSPKAK